MEQRVIPLEKHIADMQKERDDLEWAGDFKRSDFLQRMIDAAVDMRDKGEVYYPLF
jgi:hypothetical protein